MNKEQIYDAEIAPLMTKIIETCQKHGIAMVASYAIPNDEDTGLRCSTHLADETGATPFASANSLIQRGDRPPPLMLTTKDKDGNVTGMTAIIG